MIAQIDIVKLSDEDLSWILPDVANERDQVAAISANGPSVLILTRGSDGASGFLADRTEVSVPSRKVKVVDTVGAGDTFNAGMLARLSTLGLLSVAK